MAHAPASATHINTSSTALIIRHTEVPLDRKVMTNSRTKLYTSLLGEVTIMKATAMVTELVYECNQALTKWHIEEPGHGAWAFATREGHEREELMTLYYPNVQAESIHGRYFFRLPESILPQSIRDELEAARNIGGFQAAPSGLDHKIIRQVESGLFWQYEARPAHANLGQGPMQMLRIPRDTRRDLMQYTYGGITSPLIGVVQLTPGPAGIAFVYRMQSPTPSLTGEWYLVCTDSQTVRSLQARGKAPVRLLQWPDKNLPANVLSELTIERASLGMQQNVKSSPLTRSPITPSAPPSSWTRAERGVNVSLSNYLTRDEVVDADGFSNNLAIPVFTIRNPRQPSETRPQLTIVNGVGMELIGTIERHQKAHDVYEAARQPWPENDRTRRYYKAYGGGELVVLTQDTPEYPFVYVPFDQLPLKIRLSTVELQQNRAKQAQIDLEAGTPDPSEECPN